MPPPVLVANARYYRRLHRRTFCDHKYSVPNYCYTK
jgi:hypothetical protein